MIATGLLIAALCFLLGPEAKGQIDVKISRENDDGKKETFERSYDTEEEMLEDEEFQDFVGEYGRFGFYSGGDEENPFRILGFRNGRSFSFGFGDEDDDPIAFHFDSDDNSFDFDMGEDMEELVEKLEELDWEGSWNGTRFFHYDDESAKEIHVEDFSEGEEKKWLGKKKKLELQDLRFYPSPARAKFKVRFRVPEEDALTIKILDLDQQELHKRFFESFNGTYSEEFDLRNQPVGTYLLQITLGEKRLVKRLLID